MKITKDFVSNFQLVGTAIKKIDLENTFIEYNDYKDTLKREFGIKNKDSVIEKVEDNFYRGFLVSEITVNISDSDTEYSDVYTKIVIQIEGCFEFKNGKEKEFDTMLNVNGSAALFSIARSVIMSISSQMYNTGKITLPMVNFIKING